MYSINKDLLKNSAKFAGKQLFPSLFFNKIAGLVCNFIKKRGSDTGVFFCEFCEIFKNTNFHHEQLAMILTLQCHGKW